MKQGTAAELEAFIEQSLEKVQVSISHDGALAMRGRRSSTYSAGRADGAQSVVNIVRGAIERFKAAPNMHRVSTDAGDQKGSGDE